MDRPYGFDIGPLYSIDLPSFANKQLSTPCFRKIMKHAVHPVFPKGKGGVFLTSLRAFANFAILERKWCDEIVAAGWNVDVMLRVTAPCGVADLGAGSEAALRTV